MRFLLPFLLIACTDSYKEALEKNTTEAYQQFIAENPTSVRVPEIQQRLETLLKEEARAAKDPALYKSYLDDYADITVDEGEFKKFKNEYIDLIWKQTIETHTVEAYQKFIHKFKKSVPRKAKMAAQYIKVVEYEQFVSFTPVEIEQVNMANDPDGPLNGWKISADITNTGISKIEELKVRVNFLDAEGKVVSADEKSEDTKVIGVLAGREWATPDHQKPPFKPKETRTWSYMTADIPAEWSKKVKVNIVKIKLVGDL
ncbi:MAG: hypothetical protein CMK59_06230 [Proteobacteria bacterium]|nr:hypothetical protein [Pseudomonadota bacterium]